MSLIFIRKSSLSPLSRFDKSKPKATTKHTRFKLDVEGKYRLLGPSHTYPNLLSIYSDIIGRDISKISEITRREASIIMKEIGYKLNE